MTEHTPDAGGITIQDILAVGTRADELQAEIDALNAKVADLTATKDSLLKRTLPDMLRSAGITDIALTNGKRVRLNEFYVGRITDQTAAFAWLAEHNCAGIIKDNVTLAFDRGTVEVADKVVEEMGAVPGVTVERKKAVHPQTLNKFVREQMAEHGDTFPKNIFGVALISEVVIK